MKKILVLILALSLSPAAKAAVVCKFGTTQSGVPYVSIVSNQYYARVGFHHHQERDQALELCRENAIQCSEIQKRIEVQPADGEGIKYSRYQKETFYSHDTYETILGIRTESLDHSCSNHATLDDCEKGAADYTRTKLLDITRGFQINSNWPR